MKHHNWSHVMRREAKIPGTCIALRIRGIPDDCDEVVVKKVMDA